MKFLKGCYSDISVGQRVLLLVAMMFLFSSISLITAKFLQDGYASLEETPVWNLLLRQSLDTIAFFILPVLVYLYLRGKSINQWVMGNQRIDVLLLVAIALMMLVSIPIVQALAAFNASIPFPESWQLALDMENEINGVLNRFFESESVFIAIWLFIAIAVLAPIGEEFIFRGLFIRFFNDKWPPYLSITTSAFIFSLLHMQILGFIPRFLLGMLLGYFFYKTSGLIYSIWAHFVYNGISYALHIYQSSYEVLEHTESAIEGESVFGLMSCAVLFIAFLVFFIRRVSKKEILPL